MKRNPPDQRPVQEDIVWSRDPDIMHGRIYPKATYSPWLTDPLFLRIYDTVKDHTLVDVFRCYQLWSLMEQVQGLKGNCIEIGVWRGGTSALLAKALARHDSDYELYSCDTFEGVVKASDKDTGYRGGEHADTSLPTVTELLTSLDCQNVRILRGIFPDQTAHEIPDNTGFKFCHIDVDVYLSAKECFDWVWPKLRNGGIVVFDDYGFTSCEGVTRFVNEIKSNPDCFFTYNMNGQAILGSTPINSCLIV